MVRDGYTCVITGRQDESHPSPDPTSDFYPVPLEVCQILRIAIGNFDNDQKSDSVGHLPILDMHCADKRSFPLHSVYICCHIV